jgi:hypothetical protein
MQVHPGSQGCVTADYWEELVNVYYSGKGIKLKLVNIV